MAPENERLEKETPIGNRGCIKLRCPNVFLKVDAVDFPLISDECTPSYC